MEGNYEYTSSLRVNNQLLERNNFFCNSSDFWYDLQVELTKDRILKLNM